MVGDAELQDVTGHFLNLLYTGVAEFKDTFTVYADQVVMLLVFESFFELGQVFAELVFGNQVAIQQEFNGIVERSPAYPVTLVLHMNV